MREQFITASEKIKKARTGLLLDSPFFGSLALRLKMVENTDNRIYTDGTVLSYDPALVDTFTLAETKGVVAHEVLHLALGHHTRQGNRDHAVWNEAGDYAINGILYENRFELPNGVLYDYNFKGQSAETIYTTLYGRKQKPDTDGNDQQDTPGQGNKNQQGSAGTPQQSNNTQAQGQGHRQSQQGPGKQGNTPTWGDVEQAKYPQTQETEWKIAVKQAAQAQKTRGKLPGSLQRIVDEILNPLVPWSVLLCDFLDRTARNDYNWSRANTRYIHTGFIFPSLISDELPEIIVAVDTSGSIDDTDLQQVNGELQDILDTFQTTIKVLYCDVHLYENAIQMFESGDTVEMKPIGGDGTSFVPVFQYIERECIEPACLIYLTDLYGTFPSDEPSFPVLWIDTDKYTHQIAPFGETIRMH